VEEWPSTVASLVHIVAGHQELRRKKRNFLSSCKLEPLFSDLGETDGVARATVTLVSVFVGEIDALDVPPVEVLWQLSVWDLVS
jgi:hypothetical protein